MKIEFTPLIEHAKLFPPEPIKNHLPTWFREAGPSAPGYKDKPTAKELNLNLTAKAGTIKKCTPAVDYMTSGYVIRNFLDIILTQEVKEDGTEEVYMYHNTRLGKPFIDKHVRGQFPGISVKKQVLKLDGVWSIKTPPGYSSLFYQPYYHMQKDWSFMPAIVDTDTYNNAISFPFVLPDIDLNTSKERSIAAGDPILCVFPFKRDEWQCQVNDTILKNDKSRNIMLTQLHSIYKRFFHSKKIYK